MVDIDRPIAFPNPMEQLRVADPDFCEWVNQRLNLQPTPPSQSILQRLVDIAIWALSQDSGLAQAVVQAIIDLLPYKDDALIETLISNIRQAGATGATLARIMATHLGPVLTAERPLFEKFRNMVSVMMTKGTYTLTPPLELLSELLKAKETDGAECYIDLITIIFSKPISYNHSLRLVYQVPKNIRPLPVARRTFQIRQLQRVVDIHVELIPAYFDGLENGLVRLDEQALSHFIDKTIEKYHRSPEMGAHYLSLTSKLAQDDCDALQVSASLPQVRRQLGRYLMARLGHAVPVKSMTDLRKAAGRQARYACSDGGSLFLADEIDHFEVQQQNKALYTTLVKIEACFFECRSFNFDLQRACRMYPEIEDRLGLDPAIRSSGHCDAQWFFHQFANSELAEDVFMVVEFGRLMKQSADQYPGLIRSVRSALKTELQHLIGQQTPGHLLMEAYRRLVLSEKPSKVGDSAQNQAAHLLETAFVHQVSVDSPVEASAWIVCRTFESIEALLTDQTGAYRNFAWPFNQKLDWDLIADALNGHALQAAQLQTQLADRNITVYKADLQYALLNNMGRISPKEMRSLIANAHKGQAPGNGPTINLGDAKIAAILNMVAGTDAEISPRSGSVYHYPEWHDDNQGYLQHHTRVQEVTLEPGHDVSFYQATTVRRQGMIAHMRRAFEWLKPQGLALLRQWPEGDAFDYRALLDFMVDRRMGRIPSDRLYIKRLKQERDVAVLLLTDLSRSTANPVFGKAGSVLDLTKEALVLFCEALQVTGDQFALAGFSGTGRHSVDFYAIKKFADPMDDAVKHRLGALKPLRSTRMGAAIRHAAFRLNQVTARVRLLLIISDGFPNDLEYKADYAIADTRKAVQEAQSKGLFVKAVTVNIGRDPKLDDLYGRSHSHVIEYVGELPGKLLRLYSTLTRPA